MDIKIKKVSLNGRSLEVTYSKSMLTDFGEITDEITVKSDALAHSDLLDALAGLKIHYALLCDLKETVKFPEDLDIEKLDKEETEELLAPVYITGIKLTGNDSGEGVVIYGGKYLVGRCIEADSPKTTRNGTYEHKAQLFEVIESVCFEVEQYLFHGKFALKQQEFDFDAAAEEFDNADLPVVAEKPKRGRKKKEAAITLPSAEDQIAS